MIIFRYNKSMNLNQIKYVIEVAEEKSFTIAAHKLFISQPSLSKSIKLLEKELGVELFERNPISLTFAGKIFVEKAKKILAEIEDVKIEISDISNQSKTQLVIGVPSHRCYYFIPKILVKLNKEFPNCFIKIEEYPTHLLKTMIEEDKVDLYIGPESPDNMNYVSNHICDENVFLAYRKDMEISCQEEKIDLKQFNNCHFIFLSEELSLGQFERKICEDNDITINSVIECHNAETAHAMVREGLGVSFLPELFVKFLPKDNNICYKKIKGLEYKRNLSIFYKRDKYLIKPAKRFIELFKEIV